jgi:sugar phosphate isomerase/epimerase
VLKCIAVSTPGVKFSALGVKEDFKHSLRRVTELGYDAVELHIRDPKAVDVDEIVELLETYRLPVPAIGTGQAYGEEGLSFTDSNPQVRQKAVGRIKDHMDLAERLGGPQVIIGLIRGTTRPGVDRDQADDYFFGAIQECLNYNPEITLTLEPINRYETNLYNDTSSVMAIIDQVKKPNLKMLVDTFHMNIEEPDMVESILGAKEYISHVHFADSNRWAPGCGHIDFRKILEALKQIGYCGAISAEILPKPTPEECVKLTIQYYKQLGI